MTRPGPRAPSPRPWLPAALLLCALAAPAAHAQQPAAPPTAGHALSLDDALRLAAAQSEVLDIARAGVGRAEGQQRQARSAYYPQVNTSLLYNRTLRSQFSALASGGSTTPPTTQAVCAPVIPANATDAERNAALAQATTCPAAAGQVVACAKAAFRSASVAPAGITGAQSACVVAGVVLPPPASAENCERSVRL